MIEPSVDERYRVLRTLVAGSQDAVYLAHRRDTGVRVALRVWSGNLARDDAFEQALRRHAALVATVATHCPGIATVYECDRGDGGALFVAMEQPDGSPLSEVMQREGPLGAARALRLAVRMAEALEAAHSFGLVHGSLTPQNVVVVGPTEDVRLIHFGLDRLSPSTSPGGGARDGARAGTSPYQAPEQARSGQATQQSDIYGLGAILYEMLAGVSPPVSSRVRVKPTPVTEWRRSVTPALEGIVMQAIEADAQARHRDMYSLYSELRAELITARAAFRWATRRKRVLSGALGVTLAVIAAAVIRFHALPLGPIIAQPEHPRTPTVPVASVVPEAMKGLDTTPRPTVTHDVPLPAPVLPEQARDTAPSPAARVANPGSREAPAASHPSGGDASGAGVRAQLPPPSRGQEVAEVARVPAVLAPPAGPAARPSVPTAPATAPSRETGENRGAIIDWLLNEAGR